MCGRYRLKDPRQAFEWLGIPMPEEVRPRYNIAPGQRVFVLNSQNRIETMTWGLVPVWAREASKALINAKSETVRERRTFKAAVEHRRCLIPADGFYEWKRMETGKLPHLLTVLGGAPFAFAGIWERGEDGNRCCILTTSANAVLAPVHTRMPVIVRRGDLAEWASPEPLPDESFQRLTTPFPPDEMNSLVVSSLVNNASFDDPKCCDPGPAEPPRKLKVGRGRADAEAGQGTFAF